MNELIKVNAENPTFVALAPAMKDNKKALANALNNPTGKVADLINQTVNLSSVHAVASQYLDDDGIVNDTVKVTLIMEDGSAWTCNSAGVIRSLANIFDIYGTPDTWTEPIAIKVIQKETKKGRTFTLEVV